MRLSAFAFRQSGGRTKFEIYVTVMPASMLIDECSIDRWTPTNLEGYQRLPDERRLGEGRGSVVRYLVKEMGCFPTSVLVNVRGEIGFEEKQNLGWCLSGELVLDEGERLWLIDGQHRVEALRRAIQRNADFEKYPVVVSLLNMSSRFDEMMFFYVVNRRQRGVPTDLAYRHLQRMLWEKGEEWLYDLEGRKGVRIGLATQIVDYLNTDTRSPWHGRIRRIGDPIRDGYIIDDQPIIRSITDMLKEKSLEGMRIRDLVDLLIDFWSAIRRIYPEAFRESGSYTLLATPGIFSMHMLFPSVYDLCVKRGIITEEEMGNVLLRLRNETPGHPDPVFRDPVSSNFWAKTNRSSIANSTNLKSIHSIYNGLKTKISLMA
jgi:DGQHR domain-containing protein